MTHRKTPPRHKILFGQLMLVFFTFFGVFMVDIASAQAPSDASTYFQVNTSGINGSTYNGGFIIENTSLGGSGITIDTISIDMSTNIVPDIVFDPDGTAGDTVFRPFDPTGPNAGLAVAHNFAQLHPNGFGWYQLDIDFNNFLPGEVFTFAIDIDPVSIQGSPGPGPGESGSVSGLELAGATITVEYSNGDIQTGQLYRSDTTTVSNAEAVINNTLPPAPAISVVGQPVTPVIVSTPNQTITVIGTPGDTVGLLIFEGGIFTAGLPVPGGVSVDPFDINSIIDVQEVDAIIGPGGTVDIPVTLTNRDGNATIGLNYIAAVVKEPGNVTGNLSNVAVIHYDPTAVTGTAGVISGELRQWHRVSITFDGPNTNENATPNPFMDYRLNVTFVHESGQTVVVPGFYAADGNAANTSAAAGNKWRVHFMPTLVGNWTYTASFRTGTDVAISLNPGAGASAGFFDGATDTFAIAPTNKVGKDLRGQGLLQYVNGHYMRFLGSGQYFLKNGADSPENFMAYADFDGTYDTGGLISGFLHQYAPHAGDWAPGDPSWGGGRGTEIIGAINYLSSQDVNSIYFITYNIDGGDGADVWPWTSDAERERFDVSKLDQWETVFSHMTANGLQLHVLLHENENDQSLGGNSSLNRIRQLYFRELVARFSHHPALQWNLGEENNNSDAERIAFSQYIHALDAYDHPVTVHTFNGLQTDFSSGDFGTFYNGLFGNPFFEMTSIQDQADEYNGWAIDLRQRTTLTGRPWVIYGDENAAPTDVQPDMSNVNEIVRDGMWGNLIGGGAGVEWYFGYHTPTFGDIQQEDFAIAQPLWQQADIAIDFFQTYLPYWVMEPDNSLASVSSGTQPWTLAQPGNIYAVFFSGGTAGASIDLGTSTDLFEVRWFDPRIGVFDTNITTIAGPGSQTLTPPSYDAGREWLALVELAGGGLDLPPFARNDNVTMDLDEGGLINITNNDVDDIGVDVSTVTLVGAPGSITNLGNGQLQFAGSSTPTRVTFSYSVQDTMGQTSNLATVTIQVVDPNNIQPTMPPPSVSGNNPQIGVFDPAISKIGLLLPGQISVAGESLEWVVTVSNTGNSAGINVVITDILRSELRLDRVEAPGATVAVNGQQVTVTYPVINPGETRIFSIFTTTVSGGAVVNNTVVLTADNYDAELVAEGLLVNALPRTGEHIFSRFHQRPFEGIWSLLFD